MDLKKLQRIVVDALEDVKAADIQVFDASVKTDLFERVVIASGTSNRQTRALASRVGEMVKKAGGTVVATEGEETGEWVLVDLGDIVVHVMQPAIRAYYNLEEIWGSKPVKVKLGGSPAKDLAGTSGRRRKQMAEGTEDTVEVAKQVGQSRASKPRSRSADRATPEASDNAVRSPRRVTARSSTPSPSRADAAEAPRARAKAAVSRPPSGARTTASSARSPSASPRAASPKPRSSDSGPAKRPSTRTVTKGPSASAATQTPRRATTRSRDAAASPKSSPKAPAASRVRSTVSSRSSSAAASRSKKS